MAGQRKLTIIIGGDAKGGVKAMDDAEKGAGGLGSKLGSLGKAAVAGFAVVGTAAIGFAAKAASTFASVGGEVNKLIRFTGATAEEASRLRFAGQQAGLGVDTMTKSLGILSKGLATTKFDKLGLDLKDASGKARPLNDDLLKIADRFQSMPNGAEKTALAMQLFGKAGADMIPFLNKGAAGIAELEKQSDKYGTTLTGKDLQAVKDSTANHRLFSSAMEGLQIQVGRYVLPIMTKFTTFLATNMPTAISGVRTVMERLQPTFETVGHIVDTAFTKGAQVIRDDLVPALSTVANWLSNNKPVLEVLAVLIGTTLVTAVVAWGVQSVIAGAQAVASFVLAQAQAITTAATFVVQTAIMIGSYVATGIAALAAGAQMALAWVIGLGPIALVVAAVAGAAILIATHWDTIVGAAKAVWHWISDNWPLLLAVITGPIGLAVLAISRNWDSIKSGVSGAKDWVVARFNEVVGFITGLPGRIRSAASGMWDGIKDAFKSVINWVIDKWNALKFPSATFHIPHVPGTSIGGDVTIGGWDLPDIARLAKGAFVRSRPGGILANIGEGRDNEVVAPEPMLAELIRANAGGGGHYFDFRDATVIGSSKDALQRWFVEVLNEAAARGIKLKVA